MTHRRTPLASRCLLAALLALGSTAATAGETDLPTAFNLAAEAAQANRAGKPLIILYSRTDCKYCETVKRDYLKPLAKNPQHRGVLVRQINQDSEVALTDFNGNKTTQAAFASAENIKLVPVVAFYGPQGKQLAERMVGAGVPDFYQGYLDEAIAKSAAALKAR